MIFKCDLRLPQRYILGAVLFLLLGITYALRVSFSLVLTQMVYIPNVGDQNNSNKSNGELICPIKYSKPQNETTLSSITDDRIVRYEWSQELQGFILSSFFIGNIVSEIPSGILVQKYGAKLIMVLGTILPAIIVALTPVAVKYGEATGLIVTRILIGFLHGPVVACVSSLSVAWYPVETRGRAVSIIFMGSSIGIFIFSYFVGVIIQETGHWDYIFYGTAILCIIGGTLFALLCYNNPQSHPFISDEEKSYLHTKIGKYLDVEKKNLPPTPWKAIFTSKPVLAILAASAFHVWVVYIISIGFPKYINDVLHLPIQKNSIYSSVPRIINLFVSIFAGFLSDWMYTSRKISLTNVRKTFVALASIPPGSLALAASYGGCDETLVTTLMILTISLQGFETVGLNISAYDLAPNYVASLSAIVHTVHSAASFFAPYTIGILTPHAYLSEWRLVFYLSFIGYILSTIIFTIWGSAETQPWNTPKSKSNEKA